MLTLWIREIILPFQGFELQAKQFVAVVTLATTSRLIMEEMSIFLGSSSIGRCMKQKKNMIFFSILRFTVTDKIPVCV